ncbi:hypothetical protein [Streptomyces sp. V4I2]|uniref:hypothetical protein n=1 Tax=Streptomyces sp. V4I2 TaxID=3042280 RepID=UPI0027D77DDE|nr:hypothetical protein [Streptomyces sp. V4I2]
MARSQTVVLGLVRGLDGQQVRGGGTVPEYLAGRSFNHGAAYPFTGMVAIAS